MRFTKANILSAFSVTVAALVLLVFAVVPHHHHGGGVCMILEHCTQNTAESQHRGHTGCDDVNHNSSCLTETEFLTSSNDGVKCRVSSCDSHDHHHIDHLLPLLCVTVDVMTGYLHIPEKEYAYVSFTPICKSAYTGLAETLRAPPVSVC